jgi:serine/threonine-protein kinase HipA
MSTHQLSLWHHQQRVATLSHQPMSDEWGLVYDPTWQASAGAFALSPGLPLGVASHPSATIRRFIENLLPEGRALDIAASVKGVAKSNIYGLIHALGAETTGAFRFLPPDVDGSAVTPPGALRCVTVDELDQRIRDRDQQPFVLWDGQVRLSVPGYQDKLLVYVDGALHDGNLQDGANLIAPLYLPDHPLASTHILKPQPQDGRFAHMVVNEHFCMRLAQALGMPVADVALLRTPRPVLAVTRFDRQRRTAPDGTPTVRRLHTIDLCQAADVPVSFKYERHLGSTGAAAQYRDGTSFETLFAQLRHVHQKAREKLTLLRWALFQLLIGNCDAHGKNFAFFVDANGLHTAPWFDLVSVVQYPGVSHELAMAFGEVFDIRDIKAFALADFATRVGIDRRLMQREAQRMANATRQHAAALADNGPYLDSERTFAQGLAQYVLGQAQWLEATAVEATRIKKTYL